MTTNRLLPIAYYIQPHLYLQDNCNKDLCNNRSNTLKMMVQNTNMLSILFVIFSVILVQVSSQNSFIKTSGNTCMTLTHNGDCITARYVDRLDCSFRVLSSGRLVVHSFYVERGYDNLYVGSRRYTGTSGPSNLQVNVNDIISLKDEIGIFYPIHGGEIQNKDLRILKVTSY